MAEIVLYHGSPDIVRTPSLAGGRDNADYGRGFYCTQSKELAAEWACGERFARGYVNEYRLEMEGLNVLDLDEDSRTPLSWIAVLLQNRWVDGSTGDSEMVKRFIREYGIEFDGVDVACGYRADDSYFSVARLFLRSQLDENRLMAALKLGGLGRQIVLKSPLAFERLRFVGAECIEYDKWHAVRRERDEAARRAFDKMRKEAPAPGSRYFVEIARV